MLKVLIIDDETQIRMLLSRIISLEGFEVILAENLKIALRQVTINKPDIIICDVFLPDGNGVDFIPKIKAVVPDSEIILLTAHGNIEDGVQAIKNGAFDYLTKGDDNNRIIPLISNAAEKIELKKRLIKLESLINKKYTFDSIIGKSKPILSAIDIAKKVSSTDTSILLYGETGTGKEIFANAIHASSKRAGFSFVAVNCSALSHELLESEMFGYKAGAFTGAIKDKKGLFEQADNGTIFLDEIGEMPLDLQAKLLRTIECGEFIKVGDCKATTTNVRIIAATNKNLKESINKGEFREDLFYRLSVFTIELPALRERGNDIILIARNFIDAFSSKMGKTILNVEDGFYDALINYKWNGNIRELRNTIERCLILCSDNILKSTDLPLEIQMAKDGDINSMELANIEKQHICKVLAFTSGNKTEASRLLKIGLTTLYRKLEIYGINI